MAKWAVVIVRHHPITWPSHDHHMNKFVNLVGAHPPFSSIILSSSTFSFFFLAWFLCNKLIFGFIYYTFLVIYCFLDILCLLKTWQLKTSHFPHVSIPPITLSILTQTNIILLNSFLSMFITNTAFPLVGCFFFLLCETHFSFN